MQAVTFEQFLAGKSFSIPPYQRDYAWTRTNVDELFEDIVEALETHDAHYIGTFILSRSPTDTRFKIVDGQQRLTTLIMILNALIGRISDQELRIGYTFAALRSPTGGTKLILHGDNGRFFDDMIRGLQVEPDSPSQKRLLDSHTWIRSRVSQLGDGNQPIISWLHCIMKLEVLEFVEASEGKAIRMFQTVNDRGVLLSNMERAKSLLIYYSNRYLKGALDEQINSQFGECFRHFGHIRALASEKGFEVRNLSRQNFSEDDILRYHYLAFDPSPFDPAAGFDYSASADFVLNSFLKPCLKRLRLDATGLRSFIEAYVNDLESVFLALRQLLELTRISENLFALFVVSDLSALLYPLVLRLQVRGLLVNNDGTASVDSLLNLIDAIDFRVYKIGGTTASKDVFGLARASNVLSPAQISNSLLGLTTWFMNDTKLISTLTNNDVFRNPGLYRLFTEVERSTRSDIDKVKRSTHGDADITDATASSIRELVLAGQSIEHILPQTPEFGFPNYGFATQEDYIASNHKLGNLTLLTPPENSRCSNQAVESKVRDERLYRASIYQITKDFAAKWVGRSGLFSKHEIDERSLHLANFCVARWPIWSRRD